MTVEMDGHTLGLSICYDLRFPELYRMLALDGAEVLFVPAAFTLYTGKDHWHTLLRARAIENQCYVLAPAQIGPHDPQRAVLRACAGGRSVGHGHRGRAEPRRRRHR